MAGLELTVEDRAQAREMLLSLLASQTDSWAAAGLAEAVARLAADGGGPGAGPPERCSGCSPARPTPRWPKGWRKRWPG